MGGTLKKNNIYTAKVVQGSRPVVAELLQPATFFYLAGVVK